MASIHLKYNYDFGFKTKYLLRCMTLFVRNENDEVLNECVFHELGHFDVWIYFSGDFLARIEMEILRLLGYRLRCSDSE